VNKLLVRGAAPTTEDLLWAYLPPASESPSRVSSCTASWAGKIVEEWSLNDALDVMLSALEQQMRERFEQELLVARRIQQASLPKEVPTLEDWQITPF
jgi:hypothetical protein